MNLENTIHDYSDLIFTQISVALQCVTFYIKLCTIDSRSRIRFCLGNLKQLGQINRYTSWTDKNNHPKYGFT